MRLLGVARFVFIHSRAVGQIGFTISVFDRIARCHYGFGRHIDAIGSHIGDVTRLIEALRGTHCLARAHAKFTRGLLLQGRGHKRR